MAGLLTGKFGIFLIRYPYHYFIFDMLIFLKNLYFSIKNVFPVFSVFSVSTQNTAGTERETNTSKSLQCQLRLEFTNVAKEMLIMLLMIAIYCLLLPCMPIEMFPEIWFWNSLTFNTTNDPLFSASGCWTEWFDRDNPSGTGDWETLSNLRDENPGKICDNPVGIEVETTTGLSVTAAGEVIAV